MDERLKVVPMAMARSAINGHLNDCERIGKFRYGETVIECRVIKP